MSRFYGDTNVGNEDTLQTRLLTKMCDTCIFRKSAGEDLEDAALETNTFIPCHNTYKPLKELHKNSEDIKTALCRGFYNRNKNRSLILKVMQKLWGFEEIEPPEKKEIK